MSILRKIIRMEKQKQEKALNKEARLNGKRRIKHVHRDTGKITYTETPIARPYVKIVKQQKKV